MDPAKLASILEGLGISGIDPTKLSAVISLIGALGNVEVNPEGIKGYFPKEDTSSFYLPKAPASFYIPRVSPAFPIKIPKNFYYSSEVGRRLIGL